MKIHTLVLGLILLTVAAVRAQTSAPLPADVELLQDIQYGKGGDKPLYLDVLRLKNGGSKVRPGVVYIHGGSWANGSRSRLKLAEIRLAEHGYVIATIDYRLTGEAIFPAQIEDSKCAVRWLRAHSDIYHVDPDRIGVWGDSAGAHLAALVGTAQDVKDLEGQGGWDGTSSRVRAVVDMFGPTDFTPTSMRLIDKAPKGVENPNDPKSALARFLGGPISQVPEPARRASPTTYVKSDDPPFLILHGDHDSIVPLQQSELFADVLHKAGVEATLVVFPGGTHGLNAFQDEYYPKVEAFFDKYLGKP